MLGISDVAGRTVPHARLSSWVRISVIRYSRSLRAGSLAGLSLVVSVLDRELGALGDALLGVRVSPGHIGISVPRAVVHAGSSDSVSPVKAPSPAQFIGQVSKHVGTGGTT